MSVKNHFLVFQALPSSFPCLWYVELYQPDAILFSQKSVDLNKKSQKVLVWETGKIARFYNWADRSSKKYVIPIQCKPGGHRRSQEVGLEVEGKPLASRRLPAAQSLFPALPWVLERSAGKTAVGFQITAEPANICVIQLDLKPSTCLFLPCCPQVSCVPEDAL